jgi:hypothetical protein
MWNLMLDGLMMLGVYKEGIIVFLLTSFGVGYFVLKRGVKHEMDAGIKFLSSFGVGVAALFLIAYLLIWVGHFIPALFIPASFLPLLFSLFVIGKGIWDGDFKTLWHPRAAGVGFALLLLLIARLAFLKHILLPSYSDSPIHYQIVVGLIRPEAGGAVNLSLGNIFEQYYHFGFHGLTAWLIAITGLAPENAISLVGQLFLVLAPLSVVSLIYAITKNVNGALFGGLIAATGWAMPAFAVNWGKFPALGALAVAPAVLAFLGYGLRAESRNRIWIVLALGLLAGATLAHTRILVCLLLAVCGYLLSKKLAPPDELNFFQAVRFSLLFLISIWPIRQIVFDFYSTIPTAVAWIILLPFAFQTFPRLSVGIFFYILGCWLIAIAPPLLIEGIQTPLDRQFLEIMLYVPFASLGGAGFVGAMKKLSAREAAQWSAGVALCLLVTLIFLRGRSLLPNPCCVYFKDEDRQAFEWIQDNTAPDSLILISSFEGDGKIMGADAGIWLEPLLNSNTNKIAFDKDWNSETTMTEVCSMSQKEIFIYAGGTPFSFNHSQLTTSSWIEAAFSDGQTIIYQVVGCSPK